MAEVKKLGKLVGTLRARAAKAARDSDVSVAVGYTQSYAIYVHENLESYHKTGQAKFLEAPFRELGRELTETILMELKAGRTMAQALLKAGLRLQRESQKLVPIDTGALKNSAFTRLEKKS